MIYRKKYIDNTSVKYLWIKKDLLTKKLVKSFKKNLSQHYIKRLNFFIHPYCTNQQLRFYNSQNKLYCFLTFNSKVPSHKIKLSRFFLVKNVNRLLISGYQK